MGKIIEKRRRYADQRFQQLREALESASEICAGKACIYATGSFGRREASTHSDLDLFIVSLSDETDGLDRSRLSKLNEILLKAELISAAKELRFPEFSQDGRFLQHHTERRLIRSTGNQNDDFENTFTARLLLLLESAPLAGKDVHATIIDDVIERYWREFPDYYDKFMPAFLANDILRYWRTLCLNYEASTVEPRPAELAPQKRAKRKVKNYKLKHSRMLTCYSALLQLLSVYSAKNTVVVADVQQLVRLTPTERVEFVGQNLASKEVARLIYEFLEKYERFLENTNRSEDELTKIFLDDSQSKDLRDEQSQFGDLAYKILFSVGRDNPFYRRMLI
jgi:predicted nucleotidyltransferase